MYKKDFVSNHKSSMRATQEQLQVGVNLRSEDASSVASGTSGSMLNRLAIRREVNQDSMQSTHNSLQNKPHVGMSAQANTLSENGTEGSMAHNLNMGMYSERPQSKHDTEVSLNNYGQIRVERLKPLSCMSESQDDSLNQFDDLRLKVVNPVPSSTNTDNQIEDSQHVKYDVSATSDKYTEKSMQRSQRLGKEYLQASDHDTQQSVSNYKTLKHEKQTQKLDATNTHFNERNLRNEVLEHSQDLNKTN